MSEKEGRSDVIPERTIDECGAEKEPLPPVADGYYWVAVAMNGAFECEPEIAQRQAGEWWVVGSDETEPDHAVRVIAAVAAPADAPAGASPRQVEDASPGRTQSDPNQIRKAGRG